MTALLSVAASLVAVIGGLVAGTIFAARVANRLTTVVHTLRNVEQLAGTVTLLVGGFEMLKAWRVETDLRLLRIETHIGLSPLPPSTPPPAPPAAVTTTTTVRTTP